MFVAMMVFAIYNAVFLGCGFKDWKSTGMRGSTLGVQILVLGSNTTGIVSRPSSYLYVPLLGCVPQVAEHCSEKLGRNSHIEPLMGLGSLPISVQV